MKTKIQQRRRKIINCSQTPPKISYLHRTTDWHYNNKNNYKRTGMFMIIDCGQSVWPPYSKAWAESPFLNRSIKWVIFLDGSFSTLKTSISWKWVSFENVPNFCISVTFVTFYQLCRDKLKQHFQGLLSVYI